VAASIPVTSRNRQNRGFDALNWICNDSTAGPVHDIESQSRFFH
jgi:hypothetical protein